MRLILMAVALTVAVCAQAVNPELLYQKGRRAERKGKIVEAYLLYSQAAAADPDNKKYWSRSEALRTRAAMQAHVMPPVAAAASPAPDAAPNLPDLPAPTPKELEEVRKPQPPLALAGAPGVKSFDLRADSKTLFEQLAKTYGLEVVFDGDYQPTPPVHFVVNDATYATALYVAEAVTASFVVPIGPKLFMVVKDTQQKRTQQEADMAVSIPIPDPVTVQEAQELARSVQQIMELQRFAVDSTQRLVVMRGPVSKVEPARALFTQLLRHRPQIYLEVDILTVSHSTSLNLGLDLQTAVTVASAVASRSITGWGNPWSYLRIGITGITALAKATEDDSTSVYHTEIRAVDGQAASMHIGDKYPIVTTTITPIVGGSGNGGFNVPPLFNFEDLGLTLKATPKVHGSDDVTMDVEAEFKTLGVGGFEGIPVISNRKVANRVRLKFGECAVVAGLMNATEARTVGGYAGITDIPIISPLLSMNTKRKDKGEVLIVIKPRLIDAPQLATREIWTGTESRPRIPL